MFLILIIFIFNIHMTDTGYCWSLSKASKPYKGQTITISLMIGYEVNKILLDKVIPEFKKKTGINVEVQFVPYQEVIPQHTRILKSKDSKYDLINVDNIWFPFYKPYLENIDQFIKDSKLSMPKFNISDFIPELLQGYQWEENTYCFPSTFEFPLLMVRKDLFKKADFIDKNGKIIPPKNLDEYYEYAKKLTQDIDNDGKIDVYGTTLHGYKTGIFDEAISWYWGSGGELLDKSLNPIFGNALLIKTMKIYSNIYHHGYASPESTAWELGEAATAFRTGKAAMSWNWTMVAPWVLDPKLSYVADKVEFIKLFKEDTKRVHYLREASNALCIPKNSNNKKAAFLFMQFYTSPVIQETYVSDQYRIHPSRKSIIFSGKYASQVPYATIQRDVIKNHEIRLCPKIPEYTDIDQIVAMRFQQIMTGDLSAQIGIEQAVVDVQKLLSQGNYYEGNKSYTPIFSGIYK